MRRPVGATVLIASLALTAGLAVGAVGAMLLAAPVPPSFAPPTTATTVPVSQVSFYDEYTVEVGVRTTAAQRLVAPRPGRVTGSTCRPGEDILSGTATFSIDGRPLLNLATAVPLWRDLVPGDAGDDVRALQKELRRLDDKTPESGVFDSATVNGVRSLAKSQGLTISGSELRLGDVLWLPGDRVATTDCLVGPGSRVAEDSPLLESPPTVLSVQVEVPDRARAGERLLRVAGMTMPVDPNGDVTDHDALSALSRSQALRAAAEDGQSVSMSGVFALRSPVQAEVVPASSLFSVREGEGCVLQEENVVRVRILGSELGRSYVEAENGEPLRVVAIRPAAGTTC